MAYGFANSAMGLAMAGSLVALWSCADALRLEPPAGEGGTTTTTTTTSVGGGEGGQAPQPCSSNTDCAEPTSVCDTVKGLCFECLEIQHCAHKPGTVCDAGSCNCPDGDTYCGPGECIDTTTDSANCGTCDHQCFGACVDSACADPWEPVATSDAPSARARHVAVWTGSAMIVWGGATTSALDSSLGDGAVYDLSTYSWTPMSTLNAPSPRQLASAVWTDDRMIVWGGVHAGTYLNDGGVYDPVSNTWAPMSTVAAPSGRVHHTALWTGTDMVIWGGSDAAEQLPSGGRYNPTSDTWTPTAAVPSPSESRTQHTAVWNGSDMLIYGGVGDVGVNFDVYLPGAGAPGGRAYNPVNNSWLPLSTVGEPAARAQHSAVWDGTRMLVFGGYSDATLEYDDGYKYESNSWVAFSGTRPSARYRHTAVWIDNPGVMVVWGGRDSLVGPLATGGVYNPATNSWTGETPVAISARYWHTAVSTGTRMIVWGGFTSGDAPLANGGVYTP